MENPPFEDVFPIENGDFPLLCLFTGGYVGWDPKKISHNNWFMEKSARTWHLGSTITQKIP